jgi:3-methyladenine DNA glycosylase/8-oxoguanine DNA glycosylase
MDVAGELETNELRSMSYEELVELLKPARGIGEWTIQTLCIAGLGRFGVFPYSDLGIQNLLGRLYRSGTRLTTSQVQGMAQRWNDGALVLYLLMCADVLGLFPAAGRPKSVKRSRLDRSSAQDR